MKKYLVTPKNGNYQVEVKEDRELEKGEEYNVGNMRFEVLEVL